MTVKVWIAAVTVILVVPSLATNIDIVALSGNNIVDGGRLYLQCNVNGAGWTFQWMFQNRDRIANGPILDIQPLSPNKAGYYKCIASKTGFRNLETSRIVTFNVAKIWIKARFGNWITRGGRLYLQCKVTDAGWTFRWMKNEKRIKDGAVLDIQPLSEKSAGIYKCKANKGARILERSYKLDLNAVTLKCYDCRGTKSQCIWPFMKTMECSGYCMQAVYIFNPKAEGEKEKRYVNRWCVVNKDAPETAICDNYLASGAYKESSKVKDLSVNRTECSGCNTNYCNSASCYNGFHALLLAVATFLLRAAVGQ